MRELKECRAEVFRRSEQRIKAKKRRRKGLLVVCIPAALCLSVVIAITLHPEGRAGETVENHYSMQENEMAAGAGSAVAYEGPAVTVSGNGICYSYISPEEVELISGILDGVVNAAEDVRGNISVEDRVDEATGLKQNGYKEDYEICIRHEDGTQSRYLLVGSALVDPVTEERFPMGEETLTALKEALGILAH